MLGKRELVVPGIWVGKQQLTSGIWDANRNVSEAASYTYVIPASPRSNSPDVLQINWIQLDGTTLERFNPHPFEGG